MRSVIDKHLGRFISKKLLVFIIATGAFYMGNLPSQSWVELALMYIGSQAAVDVVKSLRKQ
jgi:hypothetical protein